MKDFDIIAKMFELHSDKIKKTIMKIDIIYMIKNFQKNFTKSEIMAALNRALE
jgi:hypothetical protein